MSNPILNSFNAAEKLSAEFHHADIWLMLCQYWQKDSGSQQNVSRGWIGFFFKTPCLPISSQNDVIVKQKAPSRRTGELLL